MADVKVMSSELNARSSEAPDEATLRLGSAGKATVAAYDVSPTVGAARLSTGHAKTMTGPVVP